MAQKTAGKLPLLYFRRPLPATVCQVLRSGVSGGDLGVCFGYLKREAAVYAGRSFDYNTSGQWVRSQLRSWGSPFHHSLFDSQLAWEQPDERAAQLYR